MLVVALTVIGAIQFAAYAGPLQQAGGTRVFLPLLAGDGTAASTTTTPAAAPSPSSTSTAPAGATMTPSATSTGTTPTSTVPTGNTNTPTATLPTGTTTTVPTGITNTPTATATATDVPSNTATNTPTATATHTPTATATNTPTATPIPVPCVPLSTLNCSALGVALPFTLEWNAPSGGLVDASGNGTGFTMVDPPSARIAADGPTTNPQVPGYEPGRLSVNSAAGQLAVTSNKGIQTRDPSASNNTNSQINALGVGIEAPNGTFRITTTVVNPNFAGSAGNNFQQAGSWFGLNENNFVKLVVLKTGSTTAQVQLLVENYGANATGPQPLELNTATNAIANPGSATITLIMEINRIAGTVKGFYQVNGGPETAVQGGATLSVPASFFAGVNHDNNAATPALSYAGIFTSHRNAAADQAITFAFDNFTISEGVLPEEQIVWSSIAPSEISRHEAQGAAVNGKLYVFGGYSPCPLEAPGSNQCNFKPTARSDVYDPKTNTWTRLPDMPVGLTHGGVAVIGSDIYIAGGYPASGGSQAFSTTAVRKFDTVNLTWSMLPPLPAARGGGELSEVGRVLHFFGGSNASRNDVSTHWALDLDNLAAGWVTKAPVPVPTQFASLNPTGLNHLGGVTLNGKIYVVGGQHFQDGDARFPAATLFAYDPVTNTWDTNLAPLPRGRSHTNATTFAMDGKIVVVGGEGVPLAAVEYDVIVYDPATNEWTYSTPIPPVITGNGPRGRNSGVADVIDGVIYYANGTFQSTGIKGVVISLEP